MRSASIRNTTVILALGALLAGCAGAAQLTPMAGTPAALHSAGFASSTETDLYSFAGGSADGLAPWDSPVIDPGGALYGTSSSTSAGFTGVVWKLTPSGSNYKESALYKFPASRTAGAMPEAGLVIDYVGALYGTTSAGGKGKCSNGCGVVFKLTPSKGGYAESTLYDFGVSSSKDGATPVSALLMVGTELYGTTEYGGSGGCAQNVPAGCGTIFELSTKGSGYKVLYNFKGGKDGASPETSLIAGKSGVLYGTTNDGGGSKTCPNGCGTVFEINSKGSGYKVLHAFKGGSSDGIGPSRGRGMYLSASGMLYGTTQAGGSGSCAILFIGGCGTIFELTSKGTGYKVLYNFTGGSAGQGPNEELVAGKNGDIYGTTFIAGTGKGCTLGCGTVFALTKTVGVVYDFQGGKDGATPYGGVAADKSGNLFGTTVLGGAGGCGSSGCGTVFEVTP